MIEASETRQEVFVEEALRKQTASHVAEQDDTRATTPQWLTRGSVPCLDGLRAISVILVFLCHAQATRGFWLGEWSRYVLEQGWIGVEIFFCISGFLITLLMIRERNATGSVSLTDFYCRRALRILPAYFAYVLTLAVLNQIDWVNLESKDWVSMLTYTVNYRSERPKVIGHLWSLSLEEQFYLLWPIILVLAGAKKSCRILIIYLLAAPIIRPLLRIAFPEYHALAYSSTFTRMDSIAMGCLLALLALNPSIRSKMYFSNGKASILRLTAVFALALSLAARLRWSAYGISVSHTINAICIAAIIWLSVTHPESLFGRILSTKIARRIGILSYSLYVWQQLFFNATSESWICSWPINLVAAVIAGIGSYYVIERPFLDLKSHLYKKEKSAVS